MASAAREIQCLERLGLSRALDQWVVGAAVDRLRVGTGTYLGVNVSAKSAVVDCWWSAILVRWGNRDILSRRRKIYGLPYKPAIVFRIQLHIPMVVINESGDRDHPAGSESRPVQTIGAQIKTVSGGFSGMGELSIPGNYSMNACPLRCQRNSIRKVMYDFDVVFLLIASPSSSRVDFMLAWHDYLFDSGVCTTVATHPDDLALFGKRLRILIIDGDGEGDFDVPDVICEMRKLNDVAIVLLSDDVCSKENRDSHPGADICLPARVTHLDLLGSVISLAADRQQFIKDGV
ncbi:MAG: hypothetical protein RBR29_04725 [Castellaniella sp.]|uniref:hypothetical protein n=1 Tax=Castellaniella sp. TaxID=1955812 RepID=UPI002A35BF59|nr:hypothetical protein [Castellaniella sp.]MDY0309078.1 hypothetical protein [Castellaniella sp.]